MDPIETQLEAARRLREAVDRLAFAAPVTHVYDPLGYAWAPFEAYVRRYGRGPKRVAFVGMNPGPWGMAQTGVPFGEVAAVRDWMGIEALVGRPAAENPKRPVEGFACRRSEVSGRRLWGLFAQRFGSAEAFFAEHFVLNYCPLLFMAGARNLTPDKLPKAEAAALHAACDAQLRAVVAVLEPAWLIGIGRFARARAEAALAGLPVKIGEVLHPSPASPAANRGWAEIAAAQLEALGVWRAALSPGDTATPAPCAARGPGWRSGSPA